MDLRSKDAIESSKQHDITMNNVLIAEFMGMELKPNECGRLFRYHKSWDWLMPVIEKITELCEEPQELDELKHALLCVDIKSVYFIVVEFIKEYNQND